MLDLALNCNEGPINIKEIGIRQEISPKYLEHLIAPLRVAGLVKSIRGAHGGYILARPPEKIVLSEVIQVLEGSIAPSECVDDPSICSREKLCVTRDIWAEMKEAMEKVLESTTLKDLVDRKRLKERSKAAMYHI